MLKCLFFVFLDWIFCRFFVVFCLFVIVEIVFKIGMFSKDLSCFFDLIVLFKCLSRKVSLMFFVNFVVNVMVMLRSGFGDIGDGCFEILVFDRMLILLIFIMDVILFLKIDVMVLVI